MYHNIKSQKSLILPPKATNNISKVSNKDKGKYISFMCVNSLALNHPKVDILLAYTEKKFKVNCNNN